uniref:Uncharacterized protein n=1 Tax=Arundo donax TaxID=35708 RepID=A0A0A8Y1J5_ARUDO
MSRKYFFKKTMIQIASCMGSSRFM